MIISDIKLNPAEVKIREENGHRQIWCQIRKKWMVLTPEEVVRQSYLKYLISDKNYWPSHISVEREIATAQVRKRFDILVFGGDTRPWMIVECKAPDIQLSDRGIQQILKYNLDLKASYLSLSNGLSTVVFDTLNENWISALPEFPV